REPDSVDQHPVRPVVADADRDPGRAAAEIRGAARFLVHLRIRPRDRRGDEGAAHMKGTTACMLATALVAAFPAARPAGQAPAAPAPHFQVDPTFPKVPNNWVLGDASSVAVDRRDHVFILHRPRTVPADKKDRAAPPVLEYDAAG